MRSLRGYRWRWVDVDGLPYFDWMGMLGLTICAACAVFMVWVYCALYALLRSLVVLLVVMTKAFALALILGAGMAVSSCTPRGGEPLDLLTSPLSSVSVSPIIDRSQPPPQNRLVLPEPPRPQ